MGYHAMKLFSYPEKGHMESIYFMYTTNVLLVTTSGTNLALDKLK